MTVGSHTLPSELMRTCSDGMMSCMSQWAYGVTNGLFFVLALLGFSVAILLATGRFGSKRSFGYAGFVGMVGSIWLSIMQLMDWSIASIFIIVGIVGIVIMIMDDR